MTDLTASDWTLFEPHLNGLNHQKNSNGAVEFISVDSNAEPRRRRVRRQGPVAFSRKFLTFFARFAIFWATVDDLHAILTCNQDRFSTSSSGILIVLVSTFLFTISHWLLPLLQMQRFLACPKR